MWFTIVSLVLILIYAVKIQNVGQAFGFEFALASWDPGLYRVDMKPDTVERAIQSISAAGALHSSVDKTTASARVVSHHVPYEVPSVSRGRVSPSLHADSGFFSQSTTMRGSAKLYILRI